MVFNNLLLHSHSFTEKQIKEEDLQLTKSLMNCVAEAIFLVGSDGTILYFNNAACCLFGYSCEELLSMSVEDLNPNFPSKFWSQYWETLKQHGSLSFVSLCKTQQGQSILGTITLTYIECGNSEYSALSIRKIDKLTQKDLKHSENRFQTVLEETDVIIFIVRDDQICYANSMFEDITGYTNEELLIHIDLFQQFQFDYVHCTVPRYREVKLLTKNGEECWLDYSVKVIEFAGKLAKLVTAVDITKYKQAEQKIKQVLEREKERGESRVQLVSMVSHELRVPLNIISFCTNLLKRHSNDWSKDKIQEYINRLQKGVEMLSLLIDEVLIIGKAETGKLKFEPKPLNLLQFCHNLLAELYPHESYQNLINFCCQSDCSSVSVDKIMLQIILTNLLENAIKYSPSGNIVDFIVSCQDGKVIFQIKDRGIGIAPADQERLFEPFYRGKNVDNLPGNGLGLAIVKNLVDIHCGEITVKSQVGVGTEFALALPIAGIALPLQN
jgi:PAS domain S-box-containing protein